MNDVLNRNRNKPKDPITTVPKRDVFIVLPYLGLQSKFITEQLQSWIYKFYGCINLNIIFRNTHRINSLFPYKDRLNRSLKSKVVYKAAGTVMTFISVKRSVDCMIEKLNISKHSRRIVKHQPLRITLLQLDTILSGIILKF